MDSISGHDVGVLQRNKMGLKEGRKKDMQNTLKDLNNHLFAQLERLGDEEMTQEKLNVEVARSEAVVKIASTIIDNANTVLRAVKLKEEGLNADLQLPKMLEG